MNGVQSYYLIGFILSAAILNVFIENEAIGIKLLCTTLLFTTFVFASLFHNLKTKISNDLKHKASKPYNE